MASSLQRSNSNDGMATDCGDEYVVVTTTYPSTYGCHHGMTWSEAELLARSDHEVSKRSFQSYEEAVEAARRIRDNSEWFEGACDDDESLFSFEPPWDSAALGNHDNDEEIIIEVMKKSDFQSQQAEQRLRLNAENSRRHFKAKLENEICMLQVKDAGRVHYSRPAQAYDIPAELEIVENNKEQDSGVNMAPPNAKTIKALMNRGSEELNQFLQTCAALDSNDESKSELKDENSFIRMLQSLTALTELHLQLNASGRAVISPHFLECILKAAPHLRRTLKVLSLAYIDIEPEAVEVLGRFKMLERLDLTNSFSSEYWNDPFSSGFDPDDDDEFLPYDSPLSTCIASLENLKQLDLGHGDQEMKRYFFDYCLSPSAYDMVEDDLSDYGGRVTMHDEIMPLPWSSKARQKVAWSQALLNLVSDEDNVTPEIRMLAEEELKKCPICKVKAAKRCTACKRQWYCSVECQKRDYKAHKKLCQESF